MFYDDDDDVDNDFEGFCDHSAVVVLFFQRPEVKESVIHIFHIAKYFRSELFIFCLFLFDIRASTCLMVLLPSN